jgi:hypothetical protein
VAFIGLVLIGFLTWNDYARDKAESDVMILQEKYDAQAKELQELRGAYLELLIEDYDKEYNNSKTR